MLENARRRWPAVAFRVEAVPVQGPTAVPAIVDALQSAVARCATAGEVFCGLRFRAHAGELEIDVTSRGGGRIWHASRRTA